MQPKKLTLELGLLPLCTDNQLKYMKGNYTTKARLMRASIQQALVPHRNRIKRFFTKRVRAWVQETGLAVCYTLEHEVRIFRNKAGDISMRKGDATNYIKGLNDFIFNKTSNCPNSIMIDDRFITCCTMLQKEGDRKGLTYPVTFVTVDIYIREVPSDYKVN